MLLSSTCAVKYCTSTKVHTAVFIATCTCHVKKQSTKSSKTKANKNEMSVKNFRINIFSLWSFAMSASASSSSSAKKEKKVRAPAKFQLEPAKTGRGKCNKCKVQIEKNEIRMSKVSSFPSKSPGDHLEISPKKMLWSHPVLLSSSSLLPPVLHS